MSALWRRGDSHPESWPQWLRDADIDHCHVEIDGGTVIWHDGVWRGGVWHGGIWLDGIWLDGIWRGGIWHGGIWHGGIWRRGIWFDDDDVWRVGGPPVYRDEEAAR